MQQASWLKQLLLQHITADQGWDPGEMEAMEAAVRTWRIQLQMEQRRYTAKSASK